MWHAAVPEDPRRGCQRAALLPAGTWLRVLCVGETSPPPRHEPCRGRGREVVTVVQEEGTAKDVVRRPARSSSSTFPSNLRTTEIGDSLLLDLRDRGVQVCVGQASWQRAFRGSGERCFQCGCGKPHNQRLRTAVPGQDWCPQPSVSTLSPSPPSAASEQLRWSLIWLNATSLRRAVGEENGKRGRRAFSHFRSSLCLQVQFEVSTWKKKKKPNNKKNPKTKSPGHVTSRDDKETEEDVRSGAEV